MIIKMMNKFSLVQIKILGNVTINNINPYSCNLAENNSTVADLCHMCEALTTKVQNLRPAPATN